MMMKWNKWLMWVLVAALVLLAVCWVWRHYNPMASDSGTGPATGSSSAASYTAAVKKYEGKRIQFDMYCQAIPTSLSFKNGVTLMLDNRSGDARKISVGGTTYNLAGYGWKVITLTVPTSTLPATLPINCGSAKNVSKILLQK